jgi:hypothetical protein
MEGGIEWKGEQTNERRVNLSSIHSFPQKPNYLWVVSEDDDEINVSIS